ncbi:expressed unknown protein [Seminavis robusta]|uniref:Uncharacterized protein n=1 Tax=Seminavis robusta TaxID=568900 RepID=A0A9N8DYU5_9STRA|nr:expressed unknown protein [Seminavis robusta]|eukprot:Sro484_g152280.1 n/a (1206) ;mRNA; f:45806-49423
MGQQQQQPQQPVPQDDRSRHITLQGFNRVPLVCFALMVITLLMLCVVNVDDGTVTLPAGLGSFHYQRVYTTKNTDKHKDAKICYPQVVLEEDDFDNFQVLGGSDTTTTTTTTTRSSWNMGTVSNSIELNTNFLGPLGQGHDQVSKEFDIPVLAASSQQHQLPIPASNVTVEFKLYQMNDWSSSSSADEDDKMLVLINNVQIDLGDMTVHQPFSGTEGNIVWERSAPLQEQSEDAKMPVVYKVRITVPSSSLPGNRFTLKFQTATSKPILEQSAGIDDLIITGFYQCQQQEQPQQSPHKKINNSTAPVESTPEQTPTAAAPATPNPEVKENTEDETPEEMEESLEENGGETCAKLPAPADGVCAAANPSTLDNGVHGGKDPYAGWYSLNNDGCCQDFCRWVGGSGSGGDPGLQIKHRDSYWSCRPAGYAACTYFEGFGDTFNFAKCDGQGMPAVSKPVIEAETAAPPPLEEIKEEETPQEMEESLEEEDGETCVELPAPVDGSCPAANPSMLDNGVHSGQDPYTGWYSLNNDGCCQDFCRWVGSSGSGGDPSMAIKHHGSYWSCRPAGYTACTYFEGFGDTFNFPKCDSQGVPSTLEPEPEEEEETPEEMEESLEDEDGETCTQLPAPAAGTCAAANPSTLDNGVHGGKDPYAGWFSLNNDGCCQDFCRWVGSSGSGGDPTNQIKHRDSYWSCRPAGYSACTYFEGFGDSFNFAKCDGQGVPATPEPEEEEEEETPEEMEESLEEEDGETCTQLPAPAAGTCAAANPSTLDNGVHRGQDPYAGWFSLNNDGCCQDFCRWVGGSGSGGDPSLGIKHRESYWSCRPAGYSACTYFEGFGESFNYAKCDGQGVPAAPKPVVEAETSPPPPEPPAVEVKQEETPQGVPADPSAPQQQTVWERLTSKGRKTITVLEGSGLGSQMINMLAQKIYFEAHGKEYFVDDTEYGYRWDDNTGVLQGYFTPQFPVLQRSDWQQMTSFMGVPPRNVIFNTNDVYRDGAIEIIKSIRFSQRKHFRKEFKHDHFGLMVPEACKHLQFNQRAKQEFKTLIDANNIPNLRNVSSAAFHIRRGDKILAHESIVYSGANYVLKLLEAVGEQKIDHCFISSGDYAAVEEVQAALQEKQVGCQVHTLTQQAEHGADESVSRTNRANTVQFLAEMSQLIDATFFVGTFNSNVGSMAALLRACIYPKKRYGNSYGVDTDDWYYVRHRD